MNSIEIEDTTLAAIKEARKRRPEWVNEPNDYVIFSVLTEWIAKQGDQSLNEWIKEFF
jgi:hypothetical protein